MEPLDPEATPPNPADPWSEDETFDGDVCYRSGLLTFEGAVEIHLHPEDVKGAALKLAVKPDAASYGAVFLTLEEARTLAERLLVAAKRAEAEA